MLHQQVNLPHSGTPCLMPALYRSCTLFSHSEHQSDREPGESHTKQQRPSSLSLSNSLSASTVSSTSESSSAEFWRWSSASSSSSEYGVSGIAIANPVLAGALTVLCSLPSRAADPRYGISEDGRVRGPSGRPVEDTRGSGPSSEPKVSTCPGGGSDGALWPSPDEYAEYVDYVEYAEP